MLFLYSSDMTFLIRTDDVSNPKPRITVRSHGSDGMLNDPVKVAERSTLDQEATPELDQGASRLKSFSPTQSPQIPSSPPTQHPSLLIAPIAPSFNFSVTEHEECFVDMRGDAVFSHYPKRQPLDNLVEILHAVNPWDATDLESTAAVCKFRPVGNYKHFPHMMQAFTRCFSFFQTYPSYKPFIVKEAHQRYRESFNAGMMDIFKDIFNGTVGRSFVQESKHALIVRPAYDAGMKEHPQQGIAMQKMEHAELLRQKTSEFYNIGVEGCRPGKENPVINILNRSPDSDRTLLNVEQAKEYLSQLTTHPVDVAYFEDKEFLEQVTFMMNTDILVSPHGAQLSSILFMPTCGGVFEVRRSDMNTKVEHRRYLTSPLYV